jgi:lipopolysaccharide export system protein LptA
VEFQKLAGQTTQILTGGEVDATMDSAGEVQLIEARNDARLIMGSDRMLRGDKIFVNADGDVQTISESRLQMGDSTIVGRDFTIEQGDIITFITSHPASLRSGTQNTSADRTQARFDAATNSLIELAQTGNFRFQEGERSARSGRARFEENGSVVILEGSPAVSDPKMRIEADTIRLNQTDNSFLATGRVSTIPKDSGEPILVKAERAEGNAERITYSNGVQMWRANADLRSERLIASRGDNRLHAEGKVLSNLHGIRVRSDRFDYDEKQQNAHYAGNVRAEKQDMTVVSREMTARIQNNAVSEITARGDVIVTQRDRRGVAEQAVYDARTEVVTLTGRQAEIHDKQRGTMRGSRLVMSTTGDRVSAEGEGNAQAVSRHPVQR